MKVLRNEDEVLKAIKDLQEYGELLEVIKGKDDVIYGRVYFRDGEVHIVRYNDYGYRDMSLIILDPVNRIEHKYHYVAL